MSSVVAAVLWPLAAPAATPPRQVPAGPRPSVEQVRVEMRVRTDRPRVVVTMDYVLRPGGGTEVPLLGIEFAPARLEAMQAFLDGHELEIHLDRSQAPRLEGIVTLPGATAHHEKVSVRIRFEVVEGLQDTGSGWRVQIPLTVVNWPPRASSKTFLARVYLDGAAEIHSSFPAGFQRVELPGEEGASVYRVVLPVIPSMLRFTASPTGRTGFTFERAVDLAAVVLLAGFAILGWHRFRRLLA